jgi:hypothetical protein
MWSDTDGFGQMRKDMDRYGQMWSDGDVFMWSHAYSIMNRYVTDIYRQKRTGFKGSNI